MHYSSALAVLTSLVPHLFWSLRYFLGAKPQQNQNGTTISARLPLFPFLLTSPGAVPARQAGHRQARLSVDVPSRIKKRAHIILPSPHSVGIVHAD